jgi:hypothetical protein
VRLSRETVRVLILLTAVAFLVWPSLLVTAASLLFLLGQRAGLNPLYALLAATTGVTWLLVARCRAHFPQGSNIAMAVCLSVWLGVMLGCFLFAAQYVDISGDGQWYHQEALLRLAQGWNPVYEELTNEGFEDLGASEFVEGYPHGLWYLETVVYRATSGIEQAKGWNWVFACAAGLLSLVALDVLGVGWWRFPVAVAAAANPIFISQSLSFYNDGVMGSLSTCLIAVLVILWRAPSLEAWIIYVATLVLYINTKFLGVANAVLMVCAVVALQWLCRRGGQEMRRFLVVSTAAGVGATLLVGLHPYVTNLARHGDISYPLRDRRLFSHWDGPASVREYGRLGALFWAIYGEPRLNMTAESPMKLKRPFAATPEQLVHYRYWPDPHIGGFGIYFSEALTFSLVLLAILAGTCWRRERRLLLCLMVVLAAMLTSVLIKPFAWWLRYHPQFYLVPLMIAVTALVAMGRGAAPRWTAGLVGVVVLLLLANSARLTVVYLDGQREYTSFIREELRRIAGLSHSQPVTVYFQHLRANRQRWRDYGIDYREVRRKEELPCAEPGTIWMSHLYYCAEAKKAP